MPLTRDKADDGLVKNKKGRSEAPMSITLSKEVVVVVKE